MHGCDEMRTIKLSPVVHGKPYGSILIGTVSMETAKQFELGEEYYVDFTPARESVQGNASSSAT